MTSCSIEVFVFYSLLSDEISCVRFASARVHARRGTRYRSGERGAPGARLGPGERSDDARFCGAHCRLVLQVILQLSNLN